MMNGKNSMNVVEELKSHNDTMNIPIVMISTREITEDEKKELKKLGLNIQGKSQIINGSFMNEVRRALAIFQDV
jgi:CheY-like chemotaxis protein